MVYGRQLSTGLGAMSPSRSARAPRDIPLPGLDEGRRGYRGPAVCRVVGITYRQLDYWATTGLVEPSVRDAEGVFAIAVSPLYAEMENEVTSMSADPAFAIDADETPGTAEGQLP